MRLIDANELKEWVENWFEQNKYYHPYSTSNNIPIIELYDILEQIPTVDTELVNGSIERHGHWEAHAVSIKGVPTEVCSVCGEWTYGDCVRFCPNCGAKMDEEEEER